MEVQFNLTYGISNFDTSSSPLNCETSLRPPNSHVIPVGCGLSLSQHPSCSAFEIVWLKIMGIFLQDPCKLSWRSCMSLRHSISTWSWFPKRVRYPDVRYFRQSHKLFRFPEFLCGLELSIYAATAFTASVLLKILILFILFSALLTMTAALLTIPTSRCHSIAICFTRGICLGNYLVISEKNFPLALSWYLRSGKNDGFLSESKLNLNRFCHCVHWLGKVLTK